MYILGKVPVQQRHPPQQPDAFAQLRRRAILTFDMDVEISAGSGPDGSPFRKREVEDARLFPGDGHLDLDGPWDGPPRMTLYRVAEGAPTRTEERGGGGGGEEHVVTTGEHPFASWADMALVILVIVSVGLLITLTVTAIDNMRRFPDMQQQPQPQGEQQDGDGQHAQDGQRPATGLKPLDPKLLPLIPVFLFQEEEKTRRKGSGAHHQRRSSSPFKGVDTTHTSRRGDGSPAVPGSSKLAVKQGTQTARSSPALKLDRGLVADAATRRTGTPLKHTSAESADEHETLLLTRRSSEATSTHSLPVRLDGTGDHPDTLELLPLPTKLGKDWDTASIASTVRNRCVGDPRSCAICIEEFALGARVRVLPCGHRFHADACIDPWLTEVSSPTTRLT